MESIEDLLLKELESKFDVRPELDDGLAYIGVDSVGMAELTVELERIFNIQVRDDVVDVETVAELAEYIRQRQAEAAKE